MNHSKKRTAFVSLNILLILALFFSVASLPTAQFATTGLLVFSAGGLGLVALFVALAVWIVRRERRASRLGS